jgi:hypothetical protein
MRCSSNRRRNASIRTGLFPFEGALSIAIAAVPRTRAGNLRLPEKSSSTGICSGGRASPRSNVDDRAQLALIVGKLGASIKRRRYRRLSTRHRVQELSYLDSVFICSFSFAL